jgi:hypothetical protein
MQSAKPVKTKSEDPDQRVIDAMERALAATTPERAGTPWDLIEENKEPERKGTLIPEGE